MCALFFLLILFTSFSRFTDDDEGPLLLLHNATDRVKSVVQFSGTCTFGNVVNEIDNSAAPFTGTTVFEEINQLA